MMRKLTILAILWPLALLGQFTIPQRTGATASGSVPPATPAFVQSALCSGNAATVTCTFPAAVTAGDFLTATLAIPVGSDVNAATVADSINGSWTQNGGCFSAFNVESSQYYFPNTASGSPTVTLSLSPVPPSDAFIVISEYSGVATSSPVDVPLTCGTIETSSAPVAPSITTVTAGDLIINGMGFAGNPGNISVTSPYAIAGTTTSGDGWDAWAVDSGTGSFAPTTFTVQFPNTSYAFSTAYKAAP